MTADPIAAELAAAGHRTARQPVRQQSERDGQQQERQDKQDHHAPRDRDGRPAPDDARRDSSSRQRPRPEPKETDQ